MPTSGRRRAASSTGSPYRLSSAAFASRLPARSATLYAVGRNRSCAGSHSLTSMPFRMPTRFAARAQDAVEPETEGGRLDFLRITRAHRCDHVRGVDAAFEHAHAAEKLQPVHGELFPPEIQARQPVRLIRPLIRKVVDRQHAGRAAEHGVSGVQRAQVHRSQTALPIVCVHDRGGPHIPAPRGPGRRIGEGCRDNRWCRPRKCRADRRVRGSRRRARSLHPQAVLRRSRHRA